MDGKKFSIDMACVRQVIETDSLNKTQSSSIVSNINVEFISTFNGRAVNIVRLDKELNISCKKEKSQSIFVEHDGHIVGFMVHDIDNIVYLNESDITHTSSQEDSIINGAILHDDEVIVKLNEKYIASLG